MTGRDILVVEDEAKIAGILKDYLVNAGYRVSCLDRGDTVVPFVKQHQPCLILLDIMIPGKDGLEVCSELRKFSNVPIIMITARVEEVDRLLGLELGADDYVCKPCSPRKSWRESRPFSGEPLPPRPKKPSPPERSALSRKPARCSSEHMNSS